MTAAPQPPAAPGRWSAAQGGVAGIVLVCVAIEAALLGADWGLWGSPRWRALAYQNGGFWIGLLGNWRPNYDSQPFAMFLSYSFLHGGPGHLAVNMLTLASLGPPVAARLGPGRFAWLYALSVLGGALGFALLATTVQPMVGASGALFGLVGAWLAWDGRDRLAALRGAPPGDAGPGDAERGASRIRPLRWSLLWPVLWSVGRAVAALVLLNAVMYWAMDGQLAWQTHLGGFVAGWAAALLLDRSRPVPP